MDGALTLDLGDLLLPDVDIQDPHFYLMSTLSVLPGDDRLPDRLFRGIIVQPDHRG